MTHIMTRHCGCSHVTDEGKQFVTFEKEKKKTTTTAAMKYLTNNVCTP